MLNRDNRSPDELLFIRRLSTPPRFQCSYIVQIILYLDAHYKCVYSMRITSTTITLSNSGNCSDDYQRIQFRGNCTPQAG